MAWFLTGRSCLLFFQLFKVGPSVNICIHYHSSHLCIIHLTSYYGCRCFRHTHLLKNLLLMQINSVSWCDCWSYVDTEHWRTRSDCASCNMQQLVRAWISPLAPPRAKSSQQRCLAPCSVLLGWLQMERQSDREGCSRDAVKAFKHVEGFL